MPERATPGTDGTLRIGPLTVFHARQGCDVTTFGRPADPGVVLFDGYLFDRAQLSHDFELASEASYVDVASAAYQRWGVDVFDKLDGAYLLAIWDPGLGKLIVGHDAIGRHPVFYASQSDGVWFGSNVLSLAASGRISNRPDRVSLALATLTSWPSVGSRVVARRPAPKGSAPSGVFRRLLPCRIRWSRCGCRSPLTAERNVAGRPLRTPHIRRIPG